MTNEDEFEYLPMPPQSGTGKDAVDQPPRPVKPEPPISKEDYDRHIRDYMPIGQVAAALGFVAAEVLPRPSLRHVWPPSYRPTK
jgi:hypothetical protein